jgi:hypothetical protein
MSNWLGRTGWERQQESKKPWNTNKIIKKMDEQMKRKNVNNEGRKNHRRLMNKLKRATDKAKKEYLHSIQDEVMELQRTEHYDLMYKKTKELGCKDNHGIHILVSKTLKGIR